MSQYDMRVESKRKESQSVTVSLVGDVLVHSNLLKLGRAQGDLSFSRQLSRVAPEILGVDCASANLESIAAGEEFGLSGFPKFNAPEELLDGLQVSGFQIMSVANNHMLDKGEVALRASIENIQRRDLNVVGAALSEDELVRGSVVEVAGFRIGFVSFTDAAKLNSSSVGGSHLNSFPGEKERVNMARRKNVVKKRLDAIRSQADVIVLQLHFGEEYHREPSSFQREYVASLCELDVDVIVGHHPHVLQPVEWVENSRGKKVLVAYSLGNFFSGQVGIHRQIGGVFSFTIEARKPEGGRHSWGVVKPALTLTYVDHQDDFVVKPLSCVVAERSEIMAFPGNHLNAHQVYIDVQSRTSRLAPDMDVR